MVKEGGGPTSSYRLNKVLKKTSSTMVTVDETSLVLAAATVLLLIKHRYDSVRAANKGSSIEFQTYTPCFLEARFTLPQHVTLANGLSCAIEQFVQFLPDAFAKGFKESKAEASASLSSNNGLISLSSLAHPVAAIGSAFASLLANSKNYVGIFVSDPQDALVVDLACQTNELVSCWWGESAVPEMELMEKILLSTEARIVVVSHDALDSVLGIAGSCLKLKYIFVSGVEKLSAHHVQLANNMKLKIECLSDVIKGKESNKQTTSDTAKRGPSDICSIVFELASGKHSKSRLLRGVILTHLNLAVSTSAVYITLAQDQKIGSSDVLLLAGSSKSTTSGARLFERTLAYAVLIAYGFFPPEHMLIW
ncbi:hypothetical protein HDU83_007123 [Entophlyctis luteolus]|nr:hypothetical protein HDU83_007123 [Entophlyctis luteolus]